jgi:hypothetical protein
VRIGLLADTHIPGASESLPLRVKEVFAGVDLILHAGDIYIASVLDELEELAPVLAAKGDDDYVVDNDNRVKETHTLVINGICLHLIHKMPSTLFRAWIRGKSQDGELDNAPDVLVFGHTHCDLIYDLEGILLINPGTPTFPKYPAALGTVGIIDIESGKVIPNIIHLL